MTAFLSKVKQIVDGLKIEIYLSVVKFFENLSTKNCVY